MKKTHTRMSAAVIVLCAAFFLCHSLGAQVRTALMDVVFNSAHTDLVRALIEGGANVNAINNDGLTALDIAYREEKLDSAELLESSGAKRGADRAKGNGNE